MSDFANMTREEFEALVQARVEEQLSSREEAEARREAEQALAEAHEIFETLKAAIESRDAKLREYEQALASVDNSGPSAAEVAANQRLVELEEELEMARRRAEVAEAALETLAREEAAASRMLELEEAGVALDGEAAEAQYAKVRGMTDEEFASYKEELLALKVKYETASVNEKDEAVTVAALTQDDVRMIAQSLGCDPSDEKCISLVREVATRMSEVTSLRKDSAASDEDSTDDSNGDVPETVSVGEAIASAIDNNAAEAVFPNLKDQMTQAWVEYLQSKKENNS